MTTSPDQIDLHGLTVDEAIPLVDEFLHKAHKTHLLRVWVVHGKGTGAVRHAVRQQLASSPLVRHFEPADARDGGEGATVVSLAN